MPCHFSVRDIDFHPSITGVRIRVTTDVPCHLYVRLSYKPPWIHKKPSYRRGIWLNDDVRFCFTVFEDNEQNEWGSTTTHTFWKENWGPCRTKWLYLWAMVSGVACVSTSPLFKYHNTGIDPVPPWGLIFMELWSALFPPPLEMGLIFKEYWGEPPPEMALIFLEPWTS